MNQLATETLTYFVFKVTRFDGSSYTHTVTCVREQDALRCVDDHVDLVNAAFFDLIDTIGG